MAFSFEAQDLVLKISLEMVTDFVSCCKMAAIHASFAVVILSETCHVFLEEGRESNHVSSGVRGSNHVSSGVRGSTDVYSAEESDHVY